MVRAVAGGVAAAAALAGCGAGPASPGGPPGSVSQPAPASQRAPVNGTSPAPAAVSAAGSARSATAPPARSGAVPAPAHIVVAVMENHGYADVIGNPQAPFINSLASRGALFTRSYAVSHPSEPNYLALFSGSSHGVTSDQCPLSFAAPNLATGLIAAHRTFAGYSEWL